MKDYSWLFANTDLFKKSNTVRSIQDDNNQYFDRESPETDEYSRDHGVIESPVNLEVESVGIQEENLAKRANDKLEKAIQHLEVNQKTLDALTTIVNELDQKRDEFHEANPDPRAEIEPEEEPDWANMSDKEASEKLKVLKVGNDIAKSLNTKRPIPKTSRSPIQSIGEVREESHPPIDVVNELYALRKKGLNSGMSEEEMQEANTVIDKAFNVISSKGFRKKF